MPDLGKYAETVLSAYAVSITLIFVLVALSVLRAGSVKKQLKDIEDRAKSDG